MVVWYGGGGSSGMVWYHTISMERGNRQCHSQLIRLWLLSYFSRYEYHHSIPIFSSIHILPDILALGERFFRRVLPSPVLYHGGYRRQD